MPPADIVFSVKTPPRAGDLVMLSHATTAAELPSLDPVRSFSQEAVDAGRVLYLHSRPEVWNDSFSLDVASGLGAPLEGVHMELEVLPATIPLEAQNFSVPEGGTGTLAPPLIRITKPYFRMLPDLHLQVLESPQHGTLQREGDPQNETLSTFSWREVCCQGSPGGKPSSGGRVGSHTHTCPTSPRDAQSGDASREEAWSPPLPGTSVPDALAHSFFTGQVEMTIPHFLHPFTSSLWEKGLSPPAEPEALRDSVSSCSQGRAGGELNVTPSSGPARRWKSC